MAYKLPDFNLECYIYSGEVGAPPEWAPGPVRGGTVSCQLQMGRHVHLVISGLPDSSARLLLPMILLLPALTDIRGPQSVEGFDVVEVPAGSERFYRVVAVDDSAKGFDNEHRVAVLLPVYGEWGPGAYP